MTDLDGLPIYDFTQQAKAFLPYGDLKTYVIINTSVVDHDLLANEITEAMYKLGGSLRYSILVKPLETRMYKGLPPVDHVEDTDEFISDRGLVVSEYVDMLTQKLVAAL